MYRRIGIHQINYFPWIGYFNKMAKSDVFIYLDEVQLSDRGLSQRTPMINVNGKGVYLNVSVEKHGHREKKFNEVLLNKEINWQIKQLDFLKGNYGKHPFYKEVMPLIEGVLTQDYSTLIEVNRSSVECLKTILGIETKTVMQSELQFNRNVFKNDLMLALTKSCGGTVYLSGNGARKYMDVQEFEDSGVKVQYLTFNPFEYTQFRTSGFIPGLSTLDLLFNVGTKKAKDLFWENIQKNEIYE